MEATTETASPAAAAVRRYLQTAQPRMEGRLLTEIRERLMRPPTPRAGTLAIEAEPRSGKSTLAKRLIADASTVFPNRRHAYMTYAQGVSLAHLRSVGVIEGPHCRHRTPSALDPQSNLAGHAFDGLVIVDDPVRFKGGFTPAHRDAIEALWQRCTGVFVLIATGIAEWDPMPILGGMGADEWVRPSSHFTGGDHGNQ